MNLEQLRTETRRLLAERDSLLSYFSDEDINHFINDGIKHMCIEGGVYEKELSISVTNGVRSYILPLDFISVKALLNHNWTPLDFIPQEHVGAIFTITGKPTSYYVSQENFSIPAWTDSTPYTTFSSSNILPASFVTPTSPNGFIYECVIAGTSGSSQPTWVTDEGRRQTDGSVTWVCREGQSLFYTLLLFDTPTTAGGGTGTYTLFYSAMDEPLYGDNDSPNIPAQFHRLLVFYACAKCAVKAKDLNFATALITEYNSALGLEVGGSEKEG